MIAIDTNVLVRLLTRDHEAQFQAAHRLFADNPIFIADTVVLETGWVLRHAYELAPTTICEALRSAFGLPRVHLESSTAVVKALSWHESGLDFADALHLAKSERRTAFKTFDQALIKRAQALTSCMVETP